eukprot:COSAG01_NODE_20803_length_934_cov_1.471856_2_plen_116_part_00
MGGGLGLRTLTSAWCVTLPPVFSYNVAISGHFEESHLCWEGQTFDNRVFCTNHMSDEAVTVCVLTIFFLLVIGLARAGQQLSDPFGTDIVDIPVRRSVEFTCAGKMRCAASSRWM